MPNAQPLVNSFNGLTDDSAAAAKAQSLWDAGAWNADGKPDPTQGQTVPEPKPAEPVTPEVQGAVEPAKQAGSEPSEEAPEYSTVEEYLEKAGIEPESFFSLPTKLTDGGQERQVTLADLRKAHLQEADYTRKTQALAEQRKAWEQEQVQAKQVVTQQIERAQALGNLANQQLMAEFQSVDWNKLYAEDPARWSALTLQFNQRGQAIQNHLAQLEQQRQQLAEQALPQEREKLFAAMPQWRDANTLTAAKAAISQYAPTRGITNAELGSLTDHRFMLILHDASRAAALQAELTELKAKIAGKVQQVRVAPKAPEPGARITRDPKVAHLQQAREGFKRASRDTDAQARYAQALVDAGA